MTIIEATSYGVHCSAVYADLAVSGAVEQIVSELDTLGLKPDILVLNASVQLRRSFFDIPDEDFDTQFNVNLRSPLKLIQQLVPYMRESHAGRIITIGTSSKRNRTRKC